MASIHRDILIHETPENIWAAVRDFGEVDKRLAPGFVTDTSVEGDIRIVTFASGAVVHELIVDIDDEARRIAYAVVGGSLEPKHHHASMQVISDSEGRSRFVWIIDVTPDSFGEPIAEMVDEGLRVIKRTLDREAGAGPLGPSSQV
ncbi:SRPBCC family protein [Streptacidiphilus jiangxiensis]|uniref:Polyketide cyclase / dehydrase and lipid transport n=1 Tax=Streptacidiphilus jiangxiensis TaxID=235985 RepID=A0A1H7H513_STRJI|nr:SRPBCC family protein [Streptacidiphilus jiangxiensis]SEK45379.1 Polyketide cyclase / dehydrase and lipid transport [Streptacidiphilus jiangxiensis]